MISSVRTASLSLPCFTWREWLPCAVEPRDVVVYLVLAIVPSLVAHPVGTRPRQHVRLDLRVALARFLVHGRLCWEEGGWLGLDLHLLVRG